MKSSIYSHNLRIRTFINFISFQYSFLLFKYNQQNIKFKPIFFSENKNRSIVITSSYEKKVNAANLSYFSHFSNFCRKKEVCKLQGKIEIKPLSLHNKNSHKSPSLKTGRREREN